MGLCDADALGAGVYHKMVVASAALMDGNHQSVQYGRLAMGNLYTVPDIVRRCWNRSDTANLNVTEAITHSRNYFFYEMGYRFGQSGDPESGTDFNLANERMREYADLYGLTENPASKLKNPHPSFPFVNPSQSAIGQGEHNHTTVGLPDMWRQLPTAVPVIT